jgi:hypothetical protein
MKCCPRCNRVYSEDDLNFCLDDGELLQVYSEEQPTRSLRDEPPPTIVLDPPRVTNPIEWQAGQNIEPWQGSGLPTSGQVYGSPHLLRRSLDQTLPTIALILSILSITTICCFGGFYLGIPAAILGYLGMKNADRDPSSYGGRGMAVAAMVIGIVTFIVGIIHVLSAVFSSL